MAKIIEVNEKLAYAVVEPGVTFFDLYNYCVDHNLRVWPSVAALGWGSVLGNVSCSIYFLAIINLVSLTELASDFGSWFRLHSDIKPSSAYGWPRSCAR